MTSEENRRQDAQEEDTIRRRLESLGCGISHFCGPSVLLTRSFSLSFPHFIVTIRLNLVIFRACSMFRSAAPVSRSLSLSFCARDTHTHTHTSHTYAYTIASLFSSPYVLLLFLSVFSYYALPMAGIQQRVLYDHANLSKKFVRLFKVNTEGCTIASINEKFTEVYLLHLETRSRSRGCEKERLSQKRQQNPILFNCSRRLLAV